MVIPLSSAARSSAVIATFLGCGLCAAAGGADDYLDCDFRDPPTFRGEASIYSVLGVSRWSGSWRSGWPSLIAGEFDPRSAR
jgi:hypothetical protein